MLLCWVGQPSPLYPMVSSIHVLCGTTQPEPVPLVSVMLFSGADIGKRPKQQQEDLREGLCGKEPQPPSVSARGRR